jgi:hypothetical protein
MIFDKLWKLERQLEASKQEHMKNHKLLKDRKASQEEMVSAGEDASWKTNTLRHLIEGEKGSRLLRQADRLGLPTPRYKGNASDESDENEAWEVGYTGIAYLSRAAQFALRNEIRIEKKARRDEIVSWIRDIVVPVMGILSAATALIATLHK